MVKLSLRKDTITSGNKLLIGDPFTGTAQSFSTAMYSPSSSQLRALASGNGYAFKIVDVATEVAMKGQFSTEDVSEEVLDDVLEELWTPLKRCVKFGRELGIGFVIAYKDGESLGDLQSPLSYKGTDLKWWAPDPMEMGPVQEKQDFMSLDDFEWQYRNNRIDKSRIFYYQPRRAEHDWHGIGELKAIYVPLMVMAKLEEGAIHRAQVWSYQETLLKVGGGALSNKTAMQELLANVGMQRVRAVDSKDDLVELNDKAGQGAEIKDLMLSVISSASQIPKMIFEGNNQGTTTGSEINWNLWGDVVTMIHSQVSPVIFSILSKAYGFPLKSMEMNVDFYTSKQKRIEMEMLEIDLERKKKGEDVAPVKKSGPKEEAAEAMA